MSFLRILKPIALLAVLVAAMYLLYTYVLFPLFFHYVKVVHLIDGDTLIVKDGNKIMQVQLIGVDAPERTGPLKYRQCYDDQAKHLTAVNFLADDQDVRLVRDDLLGDKDLSGRSLRYAYFKNGDLLNQRIIENGLAKQYIDISKPYQKKDLLSKAEALAKQRNLGIWDTQGCNGKF